MPESLDRTAPRAARRRRWTALAALALVAIGSARIASTYKVFNFTIDEPAHIACGMEWLDGGVYRYETQHPPLARAVAALGVAYGGNQWGGDTNMWMEGIRLLGGGKGERGLVFGRAAMLPFFWLGCAVAFLWGRRVGGDMAGLMSLLLFSTLPPVLAHAGLITTDMALTACTGAAFLCGLWWVEKPAIGRAALFGFTLGLAVLAKFSAVPFLVCAMAAIYVWHLLSVRPVVRGAIAEIRRCAPSGCVVAGVLCLVVWAGYLFSFGMTTWFPFPVPAPELFSGIDALRKHNAEGHGSYLLGKISLTGFWYYYPVALAVKTPLAMLLLLLTAAWLAFRRVLPVAAPLLFSAAILGFAISFSRINIGIRHVLPLYIGLSVAAGAGAAWIAANTRGWVRWAPCALLLLSTLSGALKHPNYLSYTNVLFWSNPEQVLADSDVDWGQDMKRLANRMARLGVGSIHFQPFNRGYLLSPLPFPKVLPIPADAPPKGWTAVSVTMWKLGVGPPWANTIEPTEKIGQSIFLYRR